MQYPWTEFFQLGLVVPAFFPEVRERKGPVLEIIRKLAADPFFQALEFSGAEEPTVQRELTKVVRSGGKSLVFSGGTYCYLGQNNLHDLDEAKREKAVKNVEKIIDEAIGYGCQILYVMGFEAPAQQGEKPGDQKIRSFVDHARRVCPEKESFFSADDFCGKFLHSPPNSLPHRSDAGVCPNVRGSPPPELQLGFNL